MIQVAGRMILGKIKRYRDFQIEALSIMIEVESSFNSVYLFSKCQ